MDRPSRPEDLVGRPVPDIALADADDSRFRFRHRVGRGPLVLFFIVRNGTPG